MTDFGRVEDLSEVIGRKTIVLLGSGASLSCTDTSATKIAKLIDKGWRKSKGQTVLQTAKERWNDLDIPEENVAEVLRELQEKRMEAHWLVIRGKEGRRAFTALKETAIGQPWTAIPTGYRCLAELVRRGSVSPYLLTTNWDELLEVALHKADLKVNLLFGAQQPDSDWRQVADQILEGDPASVEEGGATLVKLHGTVSNAYSVLGALDDITQLRDLSQRVLSHLLAAHDQILTVGWSARDQDIINVIKNNPRQLQRWSIGGRSPAPSLERFLRADKSKYIPGKADDLLFELLRLDDARANKTSAGHRSGTRDGDEEPVAAKRSPQQEYDAIYRPMRRHARHDKWNDDMFQITGTTTAIIHAANGKEIPVSNDWTNPRAAFFSPFLNLHRTSWIPDGVSIDGLPDYAIIDSTYPGDYPFAANSKDLSHAYRLLRSCEDAGFSLAGPPLNPLVNEVQVTSHELGKINAILLGAPDSNRWALLAAILRECLWDNVRLPLRMWFAMRDMTYRADSDTLWHDFKGVNRKELPNPTREFEFGSLQVSKHQHHGIVVVFPNPFAREPGTWCAILAGLQNTGTQAAMLAFADAIGRRTPLYRFETPDDGTDNWAYCLLVDAHEATQNSLLRDGDIAQEMGPATTHDEGRWDPSYLVTAYRYYDLRRKAWCRGSA